MTRDDALVEAVKSGWRAAADRLNEAERAMLAYAEKLTRDPAAMTRADLDALRAAGFDDTGILQVNLVASFFNYINRVADGVGVGRGPR